MSDDSRVLVAIAELKGQINGLSKDFHALETSGEITHESVELLRLDMNGRFKKLEHTVFGNEETEKVGLVEKVRNFDVVAKVIIGDEKGGILPLPERIRTLESGWAKLTTVAVLACSVAVEGLKWGGHVIYQSVVNKTHP